MGGQHENVLSVFEDESQAVQLLSVELEPGLHTAERVDCGAPKSFFEIVAKLSLFGWTMQCLTAPYISSFSR